MEAQPEGTSLFDESARFEVAGAAIARIIAAEPAAAGAPLEGARMLDESACTGVCRNVAEPTTVDANGQGDECSMFRAVVLWPAERALGRAANAADD